MCVCVCVCVCDSKMILCLVGWGCWIRRLHLFREVIPQPNEYPGHDTKQKLLPWNFGKKCSDPSMPLFYGPLSPGLIVHTRVPSMGQIDIIIIILFLWEFSHQCNGYCRTKWTRRLEFKSWTRLIAFHIALIHLGKVWIQLCSLQLWVNSRTD